jgi:hypothetical protein
MWRWVIGAVGVVLVVLLVRSGPVQNIVGGISNATGGWFSALVDAPERSRLIALQDRFLRNNMSLQPHQTDYIFEVTDSIDELRKFHSLYCVKGDKNPYLFGNNLMKFCSDIQQTDILTVK